MQNLSCAWIARFHDGLESNHFISKLELRPTDWVRKKGLENKHTLYIYTLK